MVLPCNQRALLQPSMNPPPSRCSGPAHPGWVKSMPQKLLPEAQNTVSEPHPSYMLLIYCHRTCGSSLLLKVTMQSDVLHNLRENKPSLGLRLLWKSTTSSILLRELFPHNGPYQCCIKHPNTRKILVHKRSKF